MPTIKDVVYKIIKKEDKALAAYYYEFKPKEDPNIKGYRVHEIFDREVDFWINELTILPIDSKTLENAVYDLHVKTGLGLFFDVFENTVLPLLLKHWKFEEG